MIPRDITVPRAGSATLRQVLSAALRDMLQAYVRLPLAGLGPEVVADYRGLVRTLGGLAKTQPGALASLVRRPNLGTLVQVLREPSRPDVDRPACMRQLVAASYGELAAMGCLPESVRVSAPPRGWTSWVRRGRFVTTHADGPLTIAPDGPRLRDAPLPRQTEDADGPLFVPLRGGAWLCRADDSPLSDVEAHPDKSGNAVDLGDRPLGQWTAALDDALALIETQFPEMAADIALVLQQVVPVGYDAERHLSASYAENLGTIYVSLHDDPMTMAEAIIHEVSHNKLNALMRLDPLLHNAFSPLFTSPVRPDPRPLHGVLLAVHAFVPVAQLYARMRAADHPWSRRPDFVRRHEAILAGNREAADVLRAHAETTEAGAAVLSEIESYVRGAPAAE